MELCSSNILPDFQWNFLKELYGSDHFPVILKLNTQCKTPATRRWNLNKADWVLFGKVFYYIENITFNIDCPVNAYNKLNKKLSKQQQNSFQKKDHLLLGGTTPVRVISNVMMCIGPIHLKLKGLFIIALLQKIKYFKKAKERPGKSTSAR